MRETFCFISQSSEHSSKGLKSTCKHKHGSLFVATDILWALKTKYEWNTGCSHSKLIFTSKMQHLNPNLIREVYKFHNHWHHILYNKSQILLLSQKLLLIYFEEPQMRLFEDQHWIFLIPVVGYLHTSADNKYLIIIENDLKKMTYSNFYSYSLTTVTKNTRHYFCWSILWVNLFISV